MCEFCSREFGSAKLLREHVAQHKWGPHEALLQRDGTVRYRCLFTGCGKVLRDRKLLRKHCLTHKPREFICEEPGCNRAFYERAKLKRHQLVHTGEKKFQCALCNKRFAYKANLKTHMRTHTGHRPYLCTFQNCGKAFAQASNRNSHMLTHNVKEKKRKRPMQEIQANGQQSQKMLRVGAGVNYGQFGEETVTPTSPEEVHVDLRAETQKISPNYRDPVTSLLNLRLGLCSPSQDERKRNPIQQWALPPHSIAAISQVSSATCLFKQQISTPPVVPASMNVEMKKKFTD